MSRIWLASAAVAVCLGTATDLGAQGQDFTFKRVKVPAAGAKRLINIQVEPVTPDERVLDNIPDVPDAPAVKAPSKGGPGAGTTMAWFWEALSPNISAASSTRMATAMGVLDGRAEDTRRITPSDTHLRNILDQYGIEILKATAGVQVSPALVLSVIAVESGGKPLAKSTAGAVGLMQLMPATAKRFGVTKRDDPGQNIRGGVAYLEFLLNEFGGDPLLALAGYNAGEGAVARNAGVPDYAETRAYVPKVIAAWRQARLLCMQPPARATDGCLFTGLKVATR